MYGTAYDETGTTRVPAGETDYLALAAAQLGKAAATADLWESQGSRTAALEQRHKLAEGYAQLGAIQRGQLPASLARVLFEQLSKES